jgi:hypothetical protein
MVLDGVTLLLVRPHDLVVAAARLTGVDLVGGTLAPGPAGALELLLPPQSTGETAFDAAVGLARARLSGPSRLVYDVGEAGPAPFSVEGLLALATAGALRTAEVELPWRLTTRIDAAGPNEGLDAPPPTAPLPGADGALGLWHLRLAGGGPLTLVPVDTDDDGGLALTLDRGRRERIIAESAQGAKPTAPFVDLSPLGGTMVVHGQWETFSWHHETVLGRDMAIRTESAGFLYPWGHPAVLVSSAVRRFLPPDGAEATAGLEEVRLLVVTEPVRGRADDGALARALPFDEVEVLQPLTVLGGEEIPPEAKHQRPATRLDALRADAAARRDALAAQEETVGLLFADAHALIDEGAQIDSDGVNSQIAGTVGRIDELEAIQRAFEDFVATHPEPPPPPPPEFLPPDGSGEVVPTEPFVPPEPGPPPLTHEQVLELQALRVEVDRLAGVLTQIEADRTARHAALATEDDLAGFGGHFADAVATVRQLRTDVPALEAFVAQVAAEADQVHDVFVWPLDRAGRRLSLPVRCDGLTLNSPALFVHRIELSETEDFPAFAPLTDATWLDRIADAWTADERRRLPVPGVAVDLVRVGPTPQPVDVLPVHELTVSGRRDVDGGFRAVLDEARVALRAVGELVPGQDGLARVAYDRRFLTEGLADQVALRIVGGLDVDFRTAADKAGGLVSPAFRADVLSRLDGPVDARALAGFLPGPPDLAAAFADATLLGIPLGSLLDGASLPKPLAIVPTPDGGASMTWKDLKLRSHGPFRTTERTTFELTVVRSPSLTQTRCRIENFSLVLPPGGDLVTLTFRALTFTQRPGSPPDLGIDGFAFALGGPLALLQTLQEKVDLGGAAPTVRSTPGGIHAGYTLSVPEVTAGMFVMRNIAASVGVEVPFDGRPIVTTLAFASRENPFNLAVSLFGGGGYLVFEIAEEGVRRLEASLDFGASVAISVGVAKAEVHALGGVRFLLRGSDVEVTGFLRIGGSVDVLGLVSVSVELRLELTFVGARPPENRARLTGRATAVIEIDVTFWSGSVELDSGEYTFLGPTPGEAAPPVSTIETREPTLDDWQRYRDAFGRA